MRALEYGDSGADVRSFQTDLTRLGYELPRFGVDGVYGKETEQAAKDACLDNHWDYCSWGPCPVWLQEWIHERATVLPTGWAPSGRGMFIQSMNTVDGVDEVDRVVSSVGLKWVCVQAHWQYEGAKSSNTYNWPDSFGLPKSYGCTSNARAVVDRFLNLGVTVIPFSYPVPGKHEEVVKILKDFAEVWESPTVVIDPEAEWYRQPDEANELAAVMRASFESWGVTSYGAPWYHRDFPFASFQSASYAMPQTYGVSTFGTTEGYGRARDEWHEYGYSRLIGLYGTYDKTDSQMRQILNVCASFKPPATAGWKWGTTSDPEWEHITNILPD